MANVVIAVVDDDLSQDEIDRLLGRLRSGGLNVAPYWLRSQGRRRFELLIGVDEPIPSIADLPLVKPTRTYARVGRHDCLQTLEFDCGVPVGTGAIQIFCGPRAENLSQLARAFERFAQLGLPTAAVSPFRPTSNPYSPSGLGWETLPSVLDIAIRCSIRSLAIHVSSAKHIELVQRALDGAAAPIGVLLRVDQCDAQNFGLLRAIGQRGLPVIVDRGWGMTLDEALDACEYVAIEGNLQISLCLAGVRTPTGRPAMLLGDIGDLPTARQLTRLPLTVNLSRVGSGHVHEPHAPPALFYAAAQAAVCAADAIFIDVGGCAAPAGCDPDALPIELLGSFRSYVTTVHDAAARATQCWRQPD